MIFASPVNEKNLFTTNGEYTLLNSSLKSGNSFDEEIMFI
jgi:hypothetical protein